MNRKKDKKAEVPAKGAGTSGQRPAKEPARPAADTNERADFGGLPDRDLKKNLGCG